jgi:hypothetical protein
MTHTVDNVRFVRKIVRRLTDPENVREPYLVEKVIRQTRSLHVTAIWDAWATLDAEARSNVLLAAYAEASRHLDLKMTIALGLTVSEAVSLGFLTYAIVPTIRSTDEVAPVQIKQAVRSLNTGFYAEGRRGFQLRFYTEEEATAAYQQLSMRFPGKPYWAITHEVGTIPSLEW